MYIIVTLTSRATLSNLLGAALSQIIAAIPLPNFPLIRHLQSRMGATSFN